MFFLLVLNLNIVISHWHCCLSGVIFKVVAGNGKSALNAWRNGTESTNDKLCRNISTTNCTDHYRDPIIDEWDTLNVTKVKSLWKYLTSNWTYLTLIIHVLMIYGTICIVLNLFTNTYFDHKVKKFKINVS
jgi:hypothetical protein